MSCKNKHPPCLKETVNGKWMHVFSVSRPEPGLRPGEAADKGCWIRDDNVFNPLKDYLKSLVA